MYKQSEEKSKELFSIERGSEGKRVMIMKEMKQKAKTIKDLRLYNSPQALSASSVYS
jgi:hypothetical protein